MNKTVLIVLSFIFFVSSFSFAQEPPPAIFNEFGYSSNTRMEDLGSFSESAANQRIQTEFNEFEDFCKKAGSGYTYGAFYDGIDYKLDQDQLDSFIEFIKQYQQPEQGHLYRILYNHDFVVFIWFGNNNISYLAFSLLKLSQ